jgi:adenine C2-methylase RlmN of 23S rRNA A2503 and tRNA A37
MGMGEPLNNYGNVKLAIEFMIDSERFGYEINFVLVVC